MAATSPLGQRGREVREEVGIERERRKRAEEEAGKRKSSIMREKRMGLNSWYAVLGLPLSGLKGHLLVYVLDDAIVY